ncbi:MAG: 50S ribosomal protein L24 [Rhodobacteraceae bacterium]|nr:50S ribosomal protein L24 [Paracoccaceae bacterium]
MAAKFKKGDKIVVIAGKDKGVRGVIEFVLTKQSKAVIRGVNLAVRHQKQTEKQQGGRVPINLPIDLSNLAIEDPFDGKPTRVGFRIENDKKVRFSKRTGRKIDV